MRCRGRFSRGMTLVEILVVVAIVGILGALLLPIVSRSWMSARLAKCSSHLHQIDNALKVHMQNHGGTLPDEVAWVSTVVGIAGTDKIIYCPESDRENGTTGTFVCPTFTQKKQINPGHPVLNNPDPQHYQAEVRYQQSHTHPERTLVNFELIHGNSWIATVTRVDPEEPYGGPPVNMHCANNVNYYNLQVGQRFEINCGSDMSNYGFNVDAGNLMDPPYSKVLLMDYCKFLIDYDGNNGDDDDAGTDLMPRHFGKVNVLYSDSSIRLTPMPAVQPSTGLYSFAKP